MSTWEVVTGVNRVPSQGFIRQPHITTRPQSPRLGQWPFSGRGHWERWDYCKRGVYSSIAGLAGLHRWLAGFRCLLQLTSPSTNAANPELGQRPNQCKFCLNNHVTMYNILIVETNILPIFMSNFERFLCRNVNRILFSNFDFLNLEFLTFIIWNFWIVQFGNVVNFS